MDLRINIIVKLIKQYFFRGKGTTNISYMQIFLKFVETKTIKTLFIT